MKSTDEPTVSHTTAMTNAELQTAIVRTYQLLQESASAEAATCATAGKPEFPRGEEVEHMRTQSHRVVHDVLHHHLIALIEIQRARAAYIEAPSVRFLAHLFGAKG